MAPLKLDTHCHSKYSSNSRLSLEFLAAQGRQGSSAVVVCTDHGSMEATARLREVLPEALVIPGIEIEADEGDFLVYSTDADYLRSLEKFHGSVAEIRRDNETAVVWAHPCVTQRVDLSKTEKIRSCDCGGLDREQIAVIMRHIDGLELFNGTLLTLATHGLIRPTYFNNLRYLAKVNNLACTGGSDAHEEEAWCKAWTEFHMPIRSVDDFIAAIKNRKVKPAYDREFFDTDVESV